MKPSSPEDPNDEALSKVLREWSVRASLPPGFNNRVWRRLAHAEAAPPSIRQILGYWIGNLLPRPALAASYVALLVSIGASAGWVRGLEKNSEIKERLSERYVQVLDPYRAAAAKSTTGEMNMPH